MLKWETFQLVINTVSPENKASLYGFLTPRERPWKWAQEEMNGPGGPGKDLISHDFDSYFFSPAPNTLSL